MAKKTNKNDDVSYVEKNENKKEQGDINFTLSDSALLNLADECFLTSLSDYHLEIYKKTLAYRFNYVDNIIKMRKEKEKEKDSY